MANLISFGVVGNSIKSSPLEALALLITSIFSCKYS